MSLESLITSGRIVDIMLLVVLFEVSLIILYWRHTGKGVPTLPLLVNIGAGGSLMLALGALLKGYGYQVVAACLVSALIFHIADIAIRWKR